MGKTRKKPKKKWTPPTEWPVNVINPAEIFLSIYKNYDAEEFRVVRTRLALDNLSVVSGIEHRSSLSMTRSIQSSAKKYFFELSKYPTYQTNYKKLDSIDFRLHTISQTDIDNLSEFTDGPNTQETARRLLRNASPIFSEGILYGNKISQIVYFKVIENMEDEIKVHLRKLSFVDDAIIYGEDGGGEAYRHHPNLVNYTVEYEADFVYEVSIESGQWGVKCSHYNHIDQGSILRIVSPKEMRADRFQYELWKRVISKVCDEEKVFEDPELREKYGFKKSIPNRYDNIGKIFMLYMGIVNYYLWQQKKNRKYYPKKNVSGSNPVEIVDEVDPIAEDKKIRIIGDSNVRIHYTNEEDLDPDTKRSYTFRKQAWERKEFYRHYKNGKVVKVKATVCRRKGAPPDAVVQKTQNIIKVV